MRRDIMTDNEVVIILKIVRIADTTRFLQRQGIRDDIQ